MLKIMCLAVTLTLAMPCLVFAQNAASNKAFFASVTDGVTLAPVNSQGWSAPVTIYTIPAALKTSSVGAVSAILSMEAALWTYNLTTALITADTTTKNHSSGTGSSSSRAAIKAWVEIDGVPMEPAVLVSPGSPPVVDGVVYADRLQATGLTVNLFCNGTDSTGLPFQTCFVTGDITLELFQQTKSANSFAFYLGPLTAKIHRVEVKAQALIECRTNGSVAPCPQATLDGYTNAQTMAAIGKSTLMLEEQQNFGSQ